MKATSRFYFMAAIMAASVVLLTFSACGDDDEPTPSNPNEEPVGPNKPDDSKPGTLLLLQTCSTCEGSTECQTCHGTGKGCRTCKGRGIYCRSCGTTGECNDCDGSGRCYSCDGKGGEQCRYCSSKPGFCPKCLGTGRYGAAKCSACNGYGYPCMYCGGDFWKDCFTCRGSGECIECYGRGSCPTCNGNPTDCTTCGGDGHCLDCEDAIGKCAACAGTGRLSIQALAFTQSGGSAAVFVQSTEQWEATADAPWIRLSRTSGIGDNAITVTADANSTATDRTGVITFSYGTSKTTVNVTQTGEDVRLSVEPTSIFVNSSGTGESITILSNTSWTISAADSWITCSPSSGSGDASISVSASAYSAGTRYTTLTIFDATGEVSQEVPVAQAKNRDELMFLMNIMEKPFGTIDVNMKTDPYSIILREVRKVYSVSANSSTDAFHAYAFDNPSFSDFTYQGMTLNMFDYYYSRYTRSAGYSFKIDESASSDEYKNCRDRIIQDFKYCMNVTLASMSCRGDLDCYEGTDADNYRYSLHVRDHYRIDIYMSYSSY